MKRNCVETALSVVEWLHLKFYYLQEEPSDVEGLHRKLSDLNELKYRLVHLRTFYYMLCGIGRRRCESILLSIEEAVLKHSMEIQFLYLCLNLRDHDDDGDDDDDGVTISDVKICDVLSNGVSDFLGMFYQEEEMKRLYQIFTDHSLLQSSSSLEQLICVMDSHLHTLQDHVHYFWRESKWNRKQFADTSAFAKIEAYIRFLKSLILFTRSCGLEHSQVEDLLTHTGTLVVYVESFIAIQCLGKEYNRLDQDSEDELLRIFPFHPYIGSIYVGVLLKLSTKKLLSHSSIILSNFIDSLLHILSYSGRNVAFSHEMQNLLGVLLYLRNILMDKMDDLIQVVICRAAILCCFIIEGVPAHLVGKLKFLFLDMEVKFKLIKDAAEEETQTFPLFPQSEYPQTNLLGFIDSVLEKLKAVITYNMADSLPLANDKFQTLHDDLEFLRSLFLTKQPHEALRNLVAAVAYDMEFVLDFLVVGDQQVPHGNAFELLSTIIERINLIKAEASETFKSKRQISVAQRNATTNSKELQTADIPFSDELMVGLTDEVQKIIDRLERGTKQLDIVSIVGMPGLGKTTLAKKVYCHDSIVHHFHVRSWCCVSQEYNKKRVLLEILGGLVGNKFVDQLSENNEDDLADKLYKELWGKKYLIILDDVWDTTAWNSFKCSFPNKENGSRILLTSRHRDVALQIKPNNEPHSLRSLTNNESWELLQKKICLGEGCPPGLLARGKAIAKYCKGLPLMILIVGGILSSMELDTWEEVTEKLRKGTLSIPEQYKETLELSYLHLPDYLKPCFLYFGAFQGDQQIRVGELLRLWISEGFVVQKKTTERDHRLEDVARGYMVELIQRSLVMVVEKGSRVGRVKTCVLHDLLLEFCKGKCKEEHFMRWLHESELGTARTPIMEQRMLYRLHVRSENVEDFESSLWFSPQVRSLFFIPHYEIGKSIKEIHSYRRLFMVMLRCKVLRVLNFRLDLEMNLFPREIGQLVHLKYLALKFMPSKVTVMIIPSSIGNLLNLETFIVSGIVSVKLPDTLWDMKKLRHLRGSQDCFVFLKLPKVENVDDSPNLENLQTLCYVEFHSLQSMIKVMRKFPNIRRLRCCLYEDENEEYKGETVALDFMGELESLSVHHLTIYDSVLEFEFPHNLKKLEVSMTQLPWNKISAIDGLPNLEILKLGEDSFKGKIWEMEEGTGNFPKLRFLQLSQLDLIRWAISPECDDDSFLPCLEKIELLDCFELEQVPILYLVSHPSIQMIKVSGCAGMKSSVEQIQEEKTNYGNEELKIIMC